jgi:tRNA uridine 5-carboxymethylaminomethyl modification enzyme
MSCVGTYSNHLSRQQADLRQFMVDEQLALDPNMDYHSIEGLRSEVKEKLAKIRPTTVVRAYDRFRSGVAN